MASALMLGMNPCLANSVSLPASRKRAPSRQAASRNLAWSGSDAIAVADASEIFIWNFMPSMAKARRQLRLSGHTGPVHSVDYSPRDNVVASGSGDQTVRLWSPTVKGGCSVLKSHMGTVRSVSFSADGNSLLSASDDKTVKMWCVRTTKFQGALSGHTNWVRCAECSADQRMAVSGSDDKTVRLWDLGSRACVQTFYDHSAGVTCVGFHPDGHSVAATR